MIIFFSIQIACAFIMGEGKGDQSFSMFKIIVRE